MAMLMMGLLLSLGSAASLALATLLWWLLPYKHAPMRELNPRRPEVRDFVLCENEYGRPCTKEDPVRWLSDFQEAVVKKANKVTAAGGLATLVHIGVLSFVRSREQSVAYWMLVQDIKHDVPVRVVVVESNPKHRSALLQLHNELGLEATDYTYVSAAKRDGCSALSYFTFSDQLFEDFVHDPALRPTVRLALQSWRSSSRERLLAPLASVGINGGGESGDEQWQTVIAPAAQRIYMAGNYSKYVVQETTPCLNVSTLMKEASISPSDIVMLTVGAEGHDVPILHQFTGFHGFRPSLLRWGGLLGEYSRSQSAREILLWCRMQLYKLGEVGRADFHESFAYLGAPV